MWSPTPTTWSDRGTKPEYHLHALDLSTLEDKIPPVLISAEATLTDGSTLIFNGAIERQRPALLEFRNKVYVTFGTFCDGARARGWVMGYGADTLKPVDPDAAGPPYALLTNRLATSPASRFITGIWMSEGGLTADQNGIYYVTGNSDPSGTSYDPVNNAEHSVVRLSLDTTTILDRFTPSRTSSISISTTWISVPAGSCSSRSWAPASRRCRRHWQVRHALSAQPHRSRRLH